MKELPLTSPEEAARYRALGLWRDTTIADRFLAAAKKHPGKTAIVTSKQRYTYAELKDLVDRLAANLLDLGFRSGDVIANQSPNAAEIPIVHLALNRIGLLYLPLHDTWREVEVRHLLQRSKARAVIIPRVYRDFDFPEMIAGMRAELPALEHVFTIGGTAPGCRELAALFEPAKSGEAELAARRPDPDLPGTCMCSGGTTALSKISRFSSNDLLAMLDLFAESIQLGESDVAAALAPAGTGATGYIFPILTPLLHGATSVILERWHDPEDAVRLIADNKCTYATAIPTQMTLMVPALEKRSPKDFAAFRCFCHAGAPLPYDVGLRIERMMDCITQSMYGTTDGGVPTETNVSDPQEKRLGTVGRVLKGFDCELWDENGKRVPSGEPGEVVYRGPDKSYGYLGDDEQTQATFTADRFYKSGDLGRFDEHGYLSIVGRVKDMILRGGRNISPRTIEELLIKHSAVLEVAVAPMPDPILGERACAFVQARSGAKLSFDDMIAFLKTEKVAVWQLPERLEIVDDLPRGPGGKILKAKLTELVTAKLKAEGVL